MLQRDIFINQIIKALEKDKSIYFLSADFGSESLDVLREKFPNNFIHCGISEQAMLDVATGLSLENNKVFCYAMAPFLSLRAIEQIKCGPGLMNLPICLISVGIGLGYADAGPTHYANEDYACINSIVGSSIFTPSDNNTTKLIANSCLEKPQFAYVRLDKFAQPDLKPEINSFDFEQGFKVFGELNNEKVILITHGKIFHNCISVQKKTQLCIINLFRSKPFPKNIISILEKSKKILVVDEQTPGGNLGSTIFENLSKNNIFPKIKVRSLKETYVFENGGREYLLKNYGLSEEEILSDIESLNK